MSYSNIDKPSKYFNTKLYTGTGASLANTGVGFQPDWTWIKQRSTTGGHRVYDVIRGATDTLYTNQNYASAVEAQTLTSFNSDGFTVGTDGGVNGSGVTFVAWNWLANGTGVSNTSGTISSTVSANTTAGFSVVSWTGNSTGGATVGHGLGVAPKMIIAKNRSNAYDWLVLHTSAGLTGDSYLGYPEYYMLLLNATNARSNFGEDTIYDPTSTTFRVGGGGDMHYINKSSNNYIAYCFADVKGYSKFGSYTGNGSTDGTFVYTGFKPAMVIMKVTSTTDGWLLMDNKRDTYNQVINQIEPNYSNAESANTARAMDFLSNGFKFRSNNTQNNQSGATYIYMAFADNPFVSSKGIPTTAR